MRYDRDDYKLHGMDESQRAVKRHKKERTPNPYTFGQFLKDEAVNWLLISAVLGTLGLSIYGFVETHF